jgi:hypothetical protein
MPSGLFSDVVGDVHPGLFRNDSCDNRIFLEVFRKDGSKIFKFTSFAHRVLFGWIF